MTEQKEINNNQYKVINYVLEKNHPGISDARSEILKKSNEIQEKFLELNQAIEKYNKLIKNE